MKFISVALLAVAAAVVIAGAGASACGAACVAAMPRPLFGVNGWGAAAQSDWMTAGMTADQQRLYDALADCNTKGTLCLAYASFKCQAKIRPVYKAQQSTSLCAVPLQLARILRSYASAGANTKPIL
jgi:hypothetical protein